MTKRALDLLLACIGLLLLAPLFALLALAIKLDSPGPVFFRQERIGRHGRPFRIFKFRTMAVTPPGSGPQITVGADARITRVGAFLRRTKLDELAQLIDVARGTMSLVGPRPEVPRYVAQYTPEQRARVLSVRPGITDFASLRYRHESDLLARAADPEREYVEVIMPEKLRVAGNYVEHASMAADLRAMGLTLRTVFVPDTPLRKVRSFMNHSPFWKRVEARMMTAGPRSRAWALLTDALVVLACWHITYLFRLGFERWQPGRPWYDDYVSFGVVAAYLLCLELFGVRQALWRYFALDDFRRIGLACITAGLISAVAVLMAQLVGVARAVLVLHPVFTLLSLGGVRMACRMLWEHAHAAAGGEDTERRYVIVLGAGETARRLLAGLHQRHGWYVLMLLDDDAAMQGLRVAGVPVAGPLVRVRDPSLTAGATHVVVALPEADGEGRKRALALAAESGLTVLAVPGAGELSVVSAARC
ncbi:glycosyl transferase possibly involved in lipopolysaccharide synthesis [Burkholderiales bacterium JOSHI_001]|nr:glycosyl transferase possibly involved in lipopolysaccharide synthesis [Burkholderiales bacterium JOSHI_001]